VEYTNQTVENINTQGEIDVVDVLPSLNLVYAVTGNMNVRAAYGRTIARPSFREFAPFNFYDFINNETTNGNPELNRTTVDNIDLRWEWFARPGEILAASGFMKSFNNPIERTLEPQAVNREVTFENQGDALVFGAEFEARKRMDIISDALRYLEVGGNLTLTHSSVTIADEELEQIRDKVPNAGDTRPLQGQSPYVINLDVSYDNPEIGTTASIFYNYFDDRLDTIERAGTPNQFERGRHTVDVVASQRIFQGVTLKASAKNILDEEYRVSQGFKGQEFINTEYNLGRTFSVSLKYRL
jgi:TonB-dependent receptor